MRLAALVICDDGRCDGVRPRSRIRHTRACRASRMGRRNRAACGPGRWRNALLAPILPAHVNPPPPALQLASRSQRAQVGAHLLHGGHVAAANEGSVDHRSAKFRRGDAPCGVSHALAGSPKACRFPVPTMMFLPVCFCGTPRERRRKRPNLGVHGSGRGGDVRLGRQALLRYEGVTS
jgi:hypothetical protein